MSAQARVLVDHCKGFYWGTCLHQNRWFPFGSSRKTDSGFESKVSSGLAQLHLTGLGHRVDRDFQLGTAA